LISANTTAINININAIQELTTGLAQSMAMSALSAPSFGKSNFSIATGNYNGTHAVAYGFSHHDGEQDIIYRLLGSQSGNISSSAASIGWSF
jgi:autotransporter adhesin